MVEFSSAYTVRTLLLEASHTDLLAAALRVRADVSRNLRLEMDARVLEAAAAILEATAQHARSLIPEHADKLMREFGDVQAAEEAVVRLRRSTLRVLPEPAPAPPIAPKKSKPGAKSVGRAPTDAESPRRTTKPKRVPKDRGPR